MPLADDVTTGAKGPRPSLIKELKDRAASPSADYSGARGPSVGGTAPAPITLTGDHLRSPEYGPNTSSRVNPVPTNLFAPDREQLLRTATEELGMQTGALTTVPEVEEKTTGVAAWDARIEAAKLGTTVRTAGEGTPGMGSRAGSAIGVDKERTEQREAAEDVAAREQRTRRAAMNLGGRRKRTETLTAEEYAEFNPKQKAAIDLNSMLVNAVTADLKDMNGKVEPADTYAGDYEDVFGAAPEDRPYAPETVKLLGTIGADLEGFNVNQILKLKGGFTREDLARLGEKPREGEAPDASLTTPQTVRNDLQDALATTLMATRRDPARGAGLLQQQQKLTGTDTMPGAGPVDRIVMNSDGTVSGPEDQQRNYQFQRALSALMNPEMKGMRPKILADVREMTGDEEWPLFLDFVGARLREVKQYGNDLDGNPTTEQLKPGGLMKNLGI